MLDYTVTSFSESKRGGQVTVTVNEGIERRSFTRHLHRQGGSLVGRNIDPRAVPLNKLYEDEFRKAKINLADAEVALEALRKKLELAKEELELETNPGIKTVFIGVIAGIEDAIDDATVSIGFAEEAVDEAEVKLTIVRRELPLMMEFRRY